LLLDLKKNKKKKKKKKKKKQERETKSPYARFRRVSEKSSSDKANAKRVQKLSLA